MKRVTGNLDRQLPVGPNRCLIFNLIEPDAVIEEDAPDDEDPCWNLTSLDRHAKRTTKDRD